MVGANDFYEPQSCGDGMKQIDSALHDLCQPLTTLQCRLLLAGLTGTPGAYREAVDRGIEDCERLVETVNAMREILVAATNRDQVTQSGAAR